MVPKKVELVNFNILMNHNNGTKGHVVKCIRQLESSFKIEQIKNFFQERRKRFPS